MVFHKTLDPGVYRGDTWDRVSDPQPVQIRIRYDNQYDLLEMILLLGHYMMRPMSLDASSIDFEDGFDRDVVFRLFKIAATWADRMHCVATPRQMEVYTEALCITKGDIRQAEVLVYESNASDDNGHTFRSPMSERPPIPAEVLQFIFDLPGDGATWSEVNPEPFDETMFLSIIVAQ